jgi:uncharacterized membrane protein YfcA
VPPWIHEIVVFLLIGGAIGFVGGLFGVGGAVMSIPVLGVFFGMSEQEAQGTSLVMVVSNVVLGLFQYHREQKLDLRMGAILAVSAVPFAYLGVRIVTLLPSNTVRVAFGVFIVCIALFMTWRLTTPLPAFKRRFPRPFAAAIGAFSGLLAGAFGIGGAMFTIPAMTVFFGLSQVASQGMALALAVPGALVGIATYAAARDVDWIVGIPLAVGGLISVPFGAHVAHRIPDRTLRWLWIAQLLVAAGGLFFKAAR